MSCSLRLSTVLLSLVPLLACGPAEVPPPSLQSIATAAEGTLSVELKAARPLSVGLNTLFYAVTQDGKPVARATLAQSPLMTMTTMKHGSPLVDPAATANAEGLFEGQVVFTMPASAMETWELGLDVTADGAAQPTRVTFKTLAVADSTARKSVTHDGKMYLVTLNFDGAPKVGSNRYRVTVHTAADMMKMKYLPLTDFALVGTPEMPSMGHGSAGNVNPAHTAGGIYEGTVNFSMAGDWVLHLDLSMPGDVAVGRLDWNVSL